MNAFSDAADTYVPDLKVISAVVPLNGLIAPDLLRSDHAPFWFKGIPAIMITDTALYRYPHYHRPTDTPEKLDYDGLARVTGGLAEVIRALASN